MVKQSKKVLVRAAGAAVFIACVLLIAGYLLVHGNEIRTPFDQNAYYPVTSVLDGDTFKVRTDGKNITVRMLGINTPETVDPRKPPECFGKEASDETGRLLHGRRVQLKLNRGREVLDKYGRYLAYVYREDGLFVNQYLVENGFAREYTYGNAFTEQRNFRKVELQAQQARKGLWLACNSI